MATLGDVIVLACACLAGFAYFACWLVLLFGAFIMTVVSGVCLFPDGSPPVYCSTVSHSSWVAMFIIGLLLVLGGFRTVVVQNPASARERPELLRP
jgi:hypothetical protein